MRFKKLARARVAASGWDPLRPPAAAQERTNGRTRARQPLWSAGLLDPNARRVSPAGLRIPGASGAGRGSFDPCAHAPRSLAAAPFLVSFVHREGGRIAWLRYLAGEEAGIRGSHARNYGDLFFPLSQLGLYGSAKTYSEFFFGWLMAFFRASGIGKQGQC